MALLDEIEVRVYRSYVKIPLIFFVPALIFLSVFSWAYFYANSPYAWETAEEFLHESMEGHFSFQYVEVRPTLTTIEAYGAELRSPDKEPVIAVDELMVRLNPLMLFAGRIEFDQAVTQGARVRLDFDQDTGRLNLFEALGLYDRPEDDSDDGESQAIAFSDLEIRDAQFELHHRRFGFSVDEVSFPKVSFFREPATRLISVESVTIPRANFWFHHHLFRAPPENGDWEFEVRDFQVEDWQWVNDGFTVQRASTDVEGIRLEASGRMRFPREDGRRNMIYDAEGTIEAAYESTAVEYFTGGNVRFDIPHLDIDIAGDFDEIHGNIDAHARVVQINGMFFENLRGGLKLNNRFLETRDLSGRFYGGELEADYAFFNMLERNFGADIGASGTDPRAMINDMIGQDHPFLEGEIEGGLRLIGEIPSRAMPRMAYNYVLMNDAMARFMQMEVTDDLTLRRDHDLLFPNQRLDMREGSEFFVDQRRLGLPQATFASGADRVEVNDFFLEYPAMEFVTVGASGLASVQGRLDEIAPYATYYNVDGLEGPAEFAMELEGFFGSPQWRLSGRMEEPGWRVREEEVLRGRWLELELDTEDGEIEIERAYAETDYGNFQATGWAGWYEPPPAPDDEPPWPNWEHRPVQPLEIEIDAQGVELSAISHLIHPELRGHGKVDGRLGLRGSMQEMSGHFEAELTDGFVREQPVERAMGRGSFDASGARLDEAAVDLGEAGYFEGDGRFDYGGEFNFALQGEAIELGELRELQQMQTRLGGKGQFFMIGEGSLDDPLFSAGAQATDVSLDGRVYGDVALTAETLDGIVYISGGLLPWLTASIEVPLRDTAPFYARFGMEELAVIDFLPELGEHPMLDDATVTGTTELYLDRDFSRYQAIFNLSALDIASRGQRISNRGPVIVGFNNGEVVAFQRASFESGGRYFSLEGAVGLNPALLDLRIEGDLDLGLLDSARAGFPEFFPEYFVDAEGYAATDINVRGTPENFVADGTVLFGPSQWELRFLQEPVIVERGLMNLGDRGIEIPEDQPMEGVVLGGATRVAGRLGYLPEHPREMDLNIWSHNMTYRFPDVVTMAFDTNLRIEASDWHDWATWLVSGDVDVLDGVYTQEFNFVEQELAGRVFGAFQPQAERYEAGLFELFPILNDISFDMQVRARDGFHLRSQFDRLAMDLEFRFDLLVQDRLVNPRITGDLDVLDGELAFQGESFDVSSGTVRFADDFTNPYLEIQAGADVRNTCEQSEFADEQSPAMTLASNMDALDTQHYHIILNIEGHLENLDFNMESNPYADQRDILSLLLTGCTVDQLTATGASGPTLEVALGPLLGRLEREIQDVVAVDEFTIMPGVERTQVHISNTLTRRWNLRAQLETGFADAAGGQQVQLEYRRWNHWTAEVSGRSHTQTGNFLLDLKLNYRLPLD